MEDRRGSTGRECNHLWFQYIGNIYSEVRSHTICGLMRSTNDLVSDVLGCKLLRKRLLLSYLLQNYHVSIQCCVSLGWLGGF